MDNSAAVLLDWKTPAIFGRCIDNSAAVHDFSVYSSSEFGAREQSSPGPALVRTGSPADDIIVRIGGLEDDNVARHGGPGNTFARGPSSFASELVPNGGPGKVFAQGHSSFALNLVHAASRGNRGAGPQGPCYGGGARRTA